MTVFKQTENASGVFDVRRRVGIWVFGEQFIAMDGKLQTIDWYTVVEGNKYASMAVMF